MTRIILILLLSVLGVVFASQSCSDEEAMKCIVNDNDVDFMHLEEAFPADEEHLTEFCANANVLLDCAIAFVERCPKSRYAEYREGMKGHKAVFEKLCDPSNAFRAEYLEHVACMNDKIVSTKDRCADHMDMFSDDFKCSTGVHNYKTCMEDSVKQCGQKTLEMFKTLYHPRLSINVSSCENTLRIINELEDF